MRLVTAAAVAQMKDGTVFLSVDHKGDLRAFRKIGPPPSHPYVLTGVNVDGDPTNAGTHRTSFAPECEVIA